MPDRRVGPDSVSGCAGLVRKIPSIVVQAEEQAKAFNAKADLSPIKDGALDEMFSQGDPVLAGVDLKSGYSFRHELRESRSGEDWAEGLGEAKAQGLELSVLVKDAAKGIDAGVRRCFPRSSNVTIAFTCSMS